MTEFIAEISSNHNGDLERCLRLIDVAANIGCQGVKLQLFRIDQLFSPEALEHKRVDGQSLWERKDWELPLSFLPIVARKCKERDLKFICTPFYLDAVDQLYQYVDAYKVASYELLWLDLLRKVAQTGKPVYLSTGMATKDEVVDAAMTVTEAGAKKSILMHCVSSYPVQRRDCNLGAMHELSVIGATMYGWRKSWPEYIQVGWSDHSCDPGVIYRAIHRWRASTIEFHLDLEGEGVEYAYGHCWLPSQIGKVIYNCKNLDVIDGLGDKEPREVELEELNWRADPSDGLRPLLKVRDGLGK